MKNLLLGLFILQAVVLSAVELKINHLVLPDNPDKDIKQAATEFAKYYQKMDGGKLTEVTFCKGMENKVGGLFLGEAAVRGEGFTLSDLKQTGTSGGYRVRAKNGNIFVAGGSSQGSLYGVYALLEQMGCKFYAQDHEIVPERANMDLSSIDIVNTPYYDIRLVSAPESNKTHDFLSRVSWIGNSFGVKRWEHNALFLVPPEKYAKSHPEYYALRDGKLVATQNPPEEMYKNWSMICMSNPEVRKIADMNFKKWVKENPEKIFYMVTQMDGFGWCQCDKCQALDTVPGKVQSDRLMDFVNYIAKRNPSVPITTLAYCKNTAPPPKIAPEKNVKVFLCPYTPEVGDIGHWFDTKHNKDFLPWYNGWIEKYPGHVYIYEYPYASWTCLAFIHEQLFYRMKRYAKDGVKGIYFCGKPPFMLSLFQYVTSKLCWNPEQPVEPLVVEFMKSYYGAAAPEMQKVYDCLKEIATKPGRVQGIAKPIKEFLTVDECFQLLKLFDQAEAKVKSDKKCLDRVKDDKSYVLRTFLENYNPVLETAKDMRAFKKRLGEYLNIILSSEYFFIKDFILPKNNWPVWLWSVAGLKVDEKDWRNDKVIKQLITNPDKVNIAAGAVTQLRVLKNGWQIPLEKAKDIEGVISYGWHCPRKPAIIIRNNMSPYSRMNVEFKLPLAPQNAKLELIGQDDDNPEHTKILITVNGEKIFQGDNPFIENGWSAHDFKIPGGTLKEGDNQLSIQVTSDASDIYSKWLAVHSIKLLTSQELGDNAYLTFSTSYAKDMTAGFANGIAKPDAVGKFTVKDASLDAGATLETAKGQLGYSASGNLFPQEGTLTVEMRPEWIFGQDNEYRTIIDLRGPNNKSGFLLYKYKTQKFITLLAYSLEKNQMLTCDCAKWQRGEWHKVSFSWNEQQKTIKLSLDGQKVALKTVELNNVKNMPVWLYIGSMRKDLEKSSGCYIRNLKIYSKDLL